MLIHPSWQKHLSAELKEPYLLELLTKLKADRAQGKQIYPPLNQMFEAIHLTPFDQVKVVILGQDPYHGPHQAHGLSFSVPKGVKIPPSLMNIFKELKSDLGIEPPSHGCLTTWAQQGVLLLNNVLTVEAGKAASHQRQGWERFTDKIIQTLNEEKEHLVFILWGAPAQKKAQGVNQKKHLVLKAPHPSPLSVYRGFYGSRPFSQANDYLRSNNIDPIDWHIPD